MSKLLARFLREEEGQDLIEYGLLAAFVSLAALAGMNFLASQINTGYSNVGNQVASS